MAPIFTVMPKKTYSVLIDEYRFEFNREYSIHFDSKALEKWFLDLLSYRCTICDPVIPFSKQDERVFLKTDVTDYYSAEGLNRHLAEEHGKNICSICARAERMFPVELRVYSQQVTLAASLNR